MHLKRNLKQLIVIEFSVAEKKKRRRVNEQKRWSTQETIELISYMQEHRNVEKPTAQMYYRKLLSEITIEHATWETIRFKVRYLKTTLQKAIDWQKSINRMEYDEEAVRDKILRICPHFDQLSDVFLTKKEELTQLDSDSKSDSLFEGNSAKLKETIWTDEEICRIFKYMQENRNFYKPSMKVYYNRLIETANIRGKTWIQVNDKVEELRDNLTEAINWHKSMSAIVKSESEEVSYRERLLKKYPHFDQLYDLFGTPIEVDVEWPGVYELSENIENTDCDVFMIEQDSEEEARQWTDWEINKILTYIRTHQNFEKPNANVYYTELLEEVAITDVTTLALQNKVNELKATFRKAIEWRKKAGEAFKNNYGEPAVKKKMSQICPYFEQLSEVFGESMKAEVVWLKTPFLGNNNAETVFDDTTFMNQDECFARIKPVRRSRNEQKKWTHAEVTNILNYMQNHRNIEKPSAYQYYTKMLSEISIDGATADTVRYKIRYLKSIFQKAIDWYNSNGRKFRERYGEANAKKRMQTICPHYDQLLDIFGSNTVLEMTGLETPVGSDNDALDADYNEFLLKNDSVGSFISDVEENTLPSINFGKTFNSEQSKAAIEDSPVRYDSKKNFEEKKLQLELEKFKWMKKTEEQKLAKQLQLEAAKFEWMKKLEERKFERETKLETEKFEWMKLMEEKKIQNDFELKKLEIVQRERMMRHEIEMKYKSKD